MTTPYTPTPFIQMTPSTPSTPTPTRGRGTGAKRGRKPRGAFPNVSIDSPRPPPQSGPSTPATRFTPVHWATPTVPARAATPTSVTIPAAPSTAANAGDASMDSGDDEPVATQPAPIIAAAASSATAVIQPGATARQNGAPDDDAEGEDELLPAMADDDYSAQLSWQSESKDNLK